MEDIDEFLKWEIIISAIKSQLFFWKASVFGTGGMRNKRNDGCELF